MYKWLIGSVVFAFLIGVYWYIGGWRTVLSVWLIWQVEPYQRELSDAPKILILGDSTAYGTGARTSEDSIAGRIAAQYPGYTIRTKAKNGMRSEDLAQQIEVLAAGETYALVLLQIGANDIISGVDIASSEQSMRKIITYLEARTEQVVWMSSGNVGGAVAYSGSRSQKLEECSREFLTMAKQVAEDTGVVYVDLFHDRDEDLFVLDSNTYMAVDGLHPSGAGYGLWFAELQPVLDPVLRE